MFKKRAREVVAALSSAPASWRAQETIESEFNPGSEKPKRGSFEIEILRDDGETVTVWSGLKLGPPRRLKFPDADDLLQAVQKALV